MNDSLFLDENGARAQSCGLFFAKNSCEKRVLRPELGASLKITLH